MLRTRTLLRPGVEGRLLDVEVGKCLLLTQAVILVEPFTFFKLQLAYF